MPPKKDKTIIAKDPKTGKKKVIQFSKQADSLRRALLYRKKERDQTLQKIKKDYKRLPWTPARRKELDKLLPLAVGAKEYIQKNNSNFEYAIGFTLYFKDIKEKRFPYPRKEKSESKKMVSEGGRGGSANMKGKFIYNIDFLNRGY
jgi:hypothetical protein